MYSENISLFLTGLRMYSRLPPFVTQILNISRYMGLSVFKNWRMREKQ
jgi:hypothetical protein